MIQSAQDFGSLIRARRKALGWTQAELAARAGTGERFVIELEGGKPSCQLDKALIVARTLGVRLEDMSATQPQHSTVSDDDGLGFLPRFGVKG